MIQNVRRSRKRRDRPNGIMAAIRFVRVASESRSTASQAHARAIRSEDEIPEMKLHDRNKSIKPI